MQEIERNTVRNLALRSMMRSGLRRRSRSDAIRQSADVIGEGLLADHGASDFACWDEALLRDKARDESTAQCDTSNAFVPA